MGENDPHDTNTINGRSVFGVNNLLRGNTFAVTPCSIAYADSFGCSDFASDLVSGTAAAAAVAAAAAAVTDSVLFDFCFAVYHSAATPTANAEPAAVIPTQFLSEADDADIHTHCLLRSQSRSADGAVSRIEAKER